MKVGKKNVNMGRRNNREFYQIPYSKLLKKLRAKLEKNGTKITITEESYTSKCDSMSLEELCKKEVYNGKRMNRLYKCQNGKVIHSDLNGAINIMRKKINLEEVKGEGLYNPKVVM